MTTSTLLHIQTRTPLFLIAQLISLGVALLPSTSQAQEKVAGDIATKVRAIPGAVVKLDKDGAIQSIDFSKCGEDRWVGLIPELQKVHSLQNLILAGPAASHERLAPLQSIESLKVLRIDRSAATDQTIREVVLRLPLLEEFGCDSCPITDAGIESLSQSKTIKRLRIPRTQITDRSLESLSRMKQLELLELSGCTQLTPRGATSLETLTKLRSIYFWPSIDSDSLKTLTQWTNLGAASFIESKLPGVGYSHLANFPKLKELDLTGTQLDSETLSAIVQGAPGVTKLKLRNNRASTDTITKNIAGFPNLVALELSESPIENPALQAISKLSRLEDLNLLRTNITGQGLAAIAGLKLKRLNLDDIPGIDDSATPIVASIGTLEFLHLGKTQVTDKGLAALTNLVHLKDLLLNNTQVTDAGVRPLESKLPQLKVKR